VGCSLIVASFGIGLPWGPIGVARSYGLVICFVIVPFAYSYVGRKGPVSVGDLWRLTASALLIALPTVLVCLFTTFQFPTLDSASLLLISGFASIGLTAVTTLATRRGRIFFLELATIVHNALGDWRVSPLRTPSGEK